MKNEIKSYLFVSGAILMWGSSAAVAKLLMSSGLQPAQTMFFISLIATFVLFFLSWFQGKLYLFKQYRLSDYLKMIFTGFWGFQAYLFSFYSAVSLMSAQEAYIINYLWPIMVVVFAAIILRERLTIKKFTALFISFVGVVVVATRGDIFSFSLGSGSGVLLATMASVFYGLFSALDKKFNYEKVTESLVFYLANWITVLVFLFFTKDLIWFNVLDLRQVFGLAWTGIIVAVLGSVFWLLALKYGDTARMSNLIFLAPFVSLIYIRILVGEKILPSSVVGLLIIVLGLMIQSIDIKRLFVKQH